MFVKIFFRLLFISILLGVSFLASAFMVLEAESFFSTFYEEEMKSGWNFALWAALLNELFLVIMSAVWLPAVNKGERKVFHMGNLPIKLLVLFLFFNTVGGASLNVIQQKLNKIQEQENRIAVLKIKQSQIEDQKTNLETFIKQNQRLNTVLVSRDINEIKEELVALEAEKQSTLAIWLEIALIFFVRFAIQLANITSVWLASWLYRQPLNSAGIFHSGNRPTTLNEEIQLQTAVLAPAKKTGGQSMPRSTNSDGETPTKISRENSPKKNKPVMAVGKEPQADLQKKPPASLPLPDDASKNSKNNLTKNGLPENNTDATNRPLSVAEEPQPIPAKASGLVAGHQDQGNRSLDKTTEAKNGNAPKPLPLSPKEKNEMTPLKENVENSPNPRQKNTPPTEDNFSAPIKQIRKEKAKPLPHSEDREQMFRELEENPKNVVEPGILKETQQEISRFFAKANPEHRRGLLEFLGIAGKEFDHLMHSKNLENIEEWNKLKKVLNEIKNLYEQQFSA